MKEKNLIVLCIVLALLMGLVFLKRNIKPEIPTVEEAAQIIGPAVNSDNIKEFVLRLGGGGGDKDNPQDIHLVKQDGRWVVKTYYGVYADEGRLKPVLEKLDQLTGELRSDRAELLDDYGIAGDKAVHVLLQLDGGDIHLVVGLKRAGYGNNFVRLGESNAVYIVAEDLLALLGAREDNGTRKLDAGQWADKRVTDLQPDDVTAVTITEMGEGLEENIIDVTREIVDNKKQWQSARPYVFGLSAAKIKTMLQSFSNTYAGDIVAASDVPGVFEAPAWKGFFSLEDGSQIIIVRGAKDEAGNNYYVKREGAAYVYRVPVAAFHNLQQQQGNILTGNPLKIEEENIAEVEVKDINGKKEFFAVKPSSPAGEAPAEGAPQGVLWQNRGGETVDAAKVNDVLNKLKDLNVEIVKQPASSLSDIMTIRVVQGGVSNEYAVSQDIKLENDKECHFLKAGGSPYGYCLSKQHITALQSVLP
jgi:hypothetical protein